MRQRFRHNPRLRLLRSRTRSRTDFRQAPGRRNSCSSSQPGTCRVNRLELPAGAQIFENWKYLVAMKRSIDVFLCIVLASLPLSALGQVAPAAVGREARVTAGGFGSMFQPDYAGNGIAQTSPNRLYGAGAYVDVKLRRWVVIEGEASWLRFNQYYSGNPPVGNGEDTYLIGPKVPIRTFRGFTPYGKFLVGLGTANFLTGHSTAIAYGGGVDYRLSRRFTLRAFDFEYQSWFLTPTLYPYGGSVGIGYKIF